MKINGVLLHWNASKGYDVLASKTENNLLEKYFAYLSNVVLMEPDVPEMGNFVRFDVSPAQVKPGLFPIAVHVEIYTSRENLIRQGGQEALGQTAFRYTPGVPGTPARFAVIQTGTETTTPATETPAVKSE